MILVGLLLVTGQMTLLGQQLAGSDLSQWAVALEGWLDGVMRDGW
jgi:hypothetical protein